MLNKGSLKVRGLSVLHQKIVYTHPVGKEDTFTCCQNRNNSSAFTDFIFMKYSSDYKQTDRLASFISRVQDIPYSVKFTLAKYHLDSEKLNGNACIDVIALGIVDSFTPKEHTLDIVTDLSLAPQQSIIFLLAVRKLLCCMAYAEFDYLFPMEEHLLDSTHHQLRENCIMFS